MIVFFDIDGTLMDDQTRIIPQSACEAIEALGKNGHLAVVNTGRTLDQVDSRIRQMPFGAIICGCGTAIYLKDQVVYRHDLTPELCRFVYEQVHECGMQVLYEAEDSVFTDGIYSKGDAVSAEVCFLQSKNHSVGEVDHQNPRFTKFVTHNAPGCRREEFLSRMEPYFSCILRGPTMVEYVPKPCSKARGMALLLEYLNADPRDTMAIGDSTNDLPMFAQATHTVCMGNGMDELKAQAEYITASVLDDGIYKALSHYGLI